MKKIQSTLSFREAVQKNNFNSRLYIKDNIGSTQKNAIIQTMGFRKKKSVALLCAAHVRALRLEAGGHPVSIPAVNESLLEY